MLATSHWDAYTVFSVISGVLLILMSFTPGMKPGSRVLSVVGGIGLAAYGIWVANQTTGTYYFSVYIFIVPVIALVSFVKTLGTPKTPARSTPTPNRPVTRPGATRAQGPAASQTRPYTSNSPAQPTPKHSPDVVTAPPTVPSETSGSGSFQPSPDSPLPVPPTTGSLAGQKIVIDLSDLSEE